MPNTNHHQICCGTDNNLGLIAAIAQDLWTHHQNGATRDQCITEAINIFENNPNAATIAGTAIWLYATTINRNDDDINGKTEPAPAADREFGQYSLHIRYSPRDAFISLSCDGREVATYSSDTPVAVIVGRVLEDMEPAESEPEPVPDSRKQPMPKLAEGGVIKSGEPYLAGEDNVAPQKDSEEPGDE